MNKKLQQNISKILLVVFAVFVLAGGITITLNSPAKAATTTLNPVADTDTQSDVAAGTNPAINASEWCHAFFKFNLSSISGTVTDAKFRVYHQNHVTNASLLLNNASPDSWVEGGTKPTTGTNISSLSLTGNGYVEFNVTSLVNTEAAGDDLITFSLTASSGSPWQNLASREDATNKPQLVITYGGATSTPTVAPTATPAPGTIGNTADGALSDNTAANYYNAIRYQAASSMTVTQMKIKVAAAGTGHMKCAIYSDSSGNPGTFLKGTNELTNLGAGWQTLTLTSGQALTAGSYYWLVSWRDGAYTIASTSVVGCNWWGSLTYAANWPTNLPAKGGAADYCHSFYATTGGATPTPGPTATNTPTPTQASTSTPTPTPVPGGTIGNTVDGTSTDNTAANYYNAIRYQASSNMTVSIMKMKIASAGTGKMKCAIYSDNSGSIGSLLRATTERSAIPAGWQTFGLTSSLSLTSGTYYWLVSWRDGGYGISSTTLTGCNYWGALTYAASFPTNLPANQGTADLQHSFYATSGSTPTPGPTATNTPTPVPSGGMKVGTNFWNKQWHPYSDYFPDGINWSTVTNPWKPEFLTDISIFKNLRFMDLVPVNNSTVTDWSQRVQKTDNQYTSVGFAVEWMIDLCNRTNEDMWICIPHMSNSAYWTSLATLIKNNLNSNLKCYVEYSNETWNYGFTQAQYCEDQGVAAGCPGSNKWYQAGAYSVWQSMKIFKAFRDVFGSQMSSRVVRVCAFSGNFDIFDQGYNSIVNSGTWNPNGEAADTFAVAPYINGGLDGADASIQSKFHAEIDNMKNSYVIPAKNIANRYGKPLCCYEGGQHLLTNAHLWSRNSAIYTEYRYMLDQWKPYFTFFDHYCMYATAASGGAWGAKESLSQSLADAHKYRALKDWIAANP